MTSGGSAGRSVPGPHAEQRQPEPGEDAGAPRCRPARGRRRGPSRGAARRAGRRPGAARRRPRPWSTGRPARRGTWPTCRRRAAANGSTTPSPSPARRSRTPRNWRSRRSSASIVTLVSRMPFHQPARVLHGADAATPRSTVARRRQRPSAAVRPSTASRSTTNRASSSELGLGRRLGAHGVERREGGVEVLGGGAFGGLAPAAAARSARPPARPPSSSSRLASRSRRRSRHVRRRRAPARR